MTTLRVRLPVPFDPSAPAAWWRVDDQGRIVERERGGGRAPGVVHRRKLERDDSHVARAEHRLDPVPDARAAEAALIAAR